MKIPSKITIGDVTYVIGVSDIIRDDVAGGCHQDQKMILISTDQNKNEAIATLFHEILHAIEAECGIKLGHRKINKMEYALAQVFDQLVSYQKSRGRS